MAEKTGIARFYKLKPVQKKDRGMLEQIFLRMRLPREWRAYSAEGNSAMHAATHDDEWIEFNIGQTRYVIRLYEAVNA
jgi:hypothetical protein